MSIKLYDIVLESEIESKGVCLSDEGFTPVKFAKLVKSSGVPYPDITVAQSLLETGRFSSKIFCENKNCFGMKFPRVRKTLASGEQYGHATFNTWQDSIKDYNLWVESRKLSNLARDAYFKRLDEIYCPPPDCGSSKKNKYGVYSDNVKQLLPEAHRLLGLTTQKQKTPINEHSYMGKYEGDQIKVGEFSKMKLPSTILKNVLRVISKKTETDAVRSKLKNGEYDSIDIPMFGQLFAFLTGRY